ncbi:uncharacterized protein LOC117647311 [Thrips palmi]|uniref:Uncharacterized protein LOC117647311 n=1 Tax=Thrips palmi TaxID=161013 RepID=A0A6P8ZPY4_THRPL|nr:uncharacterized protein LOC117647311 [Thrips palmi]
MSPGTIRRPVRETARREHRSGRGLPSRRVESGGACACLRCCSCPPGYVLLPLEAKHDVAALETWAGRVWLGALDLIRSVIVRNPGLSWGAFPEDKTEGYPAAHILGEGGFLRILYTSDDHRRKGLGGLVTRAACRALAERGKDLHANIVFPNPASEATFRKLGFKRICECTFVVYNPSRPDHPPADAPVVKF